MRCAPHPEGVSKPVCVKEGTSGVASPCPFQGANCPSSPVPGPAGPGRGCVPARGPAPPASGVTHAEATCTARASLAPNRDSETKCVRGHSMCLSDFNTKFITCSEINVRRCCLSDSVLNYLICVLSVSPRGLCILLATFMH